MEQWYLLNEDSVVERLGASPQGLDDAEATERLQEYGPNQLEERPLRSPWSVLAGQFTEVMVIVLLVATLISLFVGETTDAIMIMVIVVLNAVLGFTQEYRAERAMEKLKQLAVQTVRVRRGGQVREVEATELVPGDIVLIEAGARVPADARVLESANLRAEEAALTGESVPVDKITSAISGDSIPLGDRRNMLYMGTTVSYGRGTAIVTATGMDTELGNIATLLQAVTEEKTPLQRRMAELGKWLAVGALVIVAIVFAEGVIQGEPLTEMFLVAVSLAVAAVPEGLPAVVTIALALGAQRMVRRNALIRKLPAVETLGSVTTICSDKTGTLTENRMTVTILDVAGRSINLVQRLNTEGALMSPDEAPLGRPDPSLAILLAGGALSNDATLSPDEDGNGGYHAVGDPTEGAMVVAAARHGLWKHELERLMPRRMEAPFSSERKRMTTVHELPHGPRTQNDSPLCDIVSCLPDAPYIAFAKGAVDGLLQVSDRIWNDGTIEPLDDAWRERILGANDRFAKDGVRVLGVAMRPLEQLPRTADEDTLEQQLVFVGMTGMIDPPRPEVKQAVAECRTAGIRPVMITGDHPLTALNIAQELGIAQETNGDRDSSRNRGRIVITGQQLAAMSVRELEDVVDDVSVYARVSPEHKVKIVEALKARGHFVAMTGDGVNDAPALKRADIGVAMGITGTDVSKEAADMVLLDDNFATIVHAIEEGRTIYENIRKFVRYIISCNVGEILIMLVAPLLDYPVPLTPVQLLWINLVTDGLPALALGIDPAEPDTMQRPPNPPGESVLARGLGTYILWVGLLLGSLSLVALWWGYNLGGGVWQTIVFTTLSLSQMGNALAVRSDRESVFRIGLLSNKLLLGAIALTTVLQLGVVYLPFAQPIFGTRALTPMQLGVSILLSAGVFVAVELSKWARRLRERSRQATAA
jgi:P-type Ca2+ transporter type 2C